MVKGRSEVITMEMRTFLIIFFSGLCFLPVCFPRLYILVEEKKTWADAQKYCREMYTDLASVNNQKESDQLIATAPTINEVWIGLSKDVDSWRWSLEDKEYYGEGEADFKNWLTPQPNNFGGHQDCVSMFDRGGWNDITCSSKAKFICYTGKTNTNASSNFVYVNEKKTWKEAQGYCRKHYTDLASVRNQAENDAINKSPQSNRAWIGLHRDPWQWSDGSPFLFSNWDPDILKRSFQSSCVVLREGRWQDHNCSHAQHFVCHIDPRKQQVLRVKLTKKDSLLNLEDAADAILQQQISQMLKDQGLNKQLKLTWRKQPNGKIFSPEKEKENTYT